MNSVYFVFLTLALAVSAVPLTEEVSEVGRGEFGSTENEDESSVGPSKRASGDVEVSNDGITDDSQTGDTDEDVVNANRGSFGVGFEEEDDDILSKGIAEHMSHSYGVTEEKKIHHYPAKIPIPVAMEKSYSVIIPKHYPITVERPITYTVIKSVKVPVSVPVKMNEHMAYHHLHNHHPVSVDKVESYTVEKTIPLYVEHHPGLMSGGLEGGIMSGGLGGGMTGGLGGGIMTGGLGGGIMAGGIKEGLTGYKSTIIEKTG